MFVEEREGVDLDIGIMNHSVRTIGFWSATLMTFMVGLFAVGLVTSIESLSFLSSFFLTWAFVATMVSIHYYAPEAKKIWSHLGLNFAIIYAKILVFFSLIQF